jgi:4-hydroxy-3-methylbut-2-en-1-yl diphosphate synthase IspG/GcpE
MAVSILDDRGRVLKTIHTDAHDDNRMVEVMHEDVSPLIELARSAAIARRMSRANQGSLEKAFGAKLVGFMPDFQVEKMVREGSWGDKAAVRRWFNDPQNRDFRVWQGRV